jgi:uncharacterized SAM-binding protein YcdF (DUF218 family)
MFLLLTRVILWLLLFTLVYYVLAQLIPKEYLAWIGGIFLFVILVLVFINTNDTFVLAAGSIISFPLKPLGLSLLLLFFGITGIKKNALKNEGYFQLWTAFLILLLSSTPYLAYQLAQQAEREFIQAEQQRREICQDRCPTNITSPGTQRARAIVVLGHESPQGNLAYIRQVQINDISDRLIYASQVYQEQLALQNRPLLIISTGYNFTKDNNNQSSDLTTTMSKLGVPPDRLIIENNSVNLHSSAVAVEQILKQRGLGNKEIILITSGLNSNRARLTFAQMRFKVTPRTEEFYTLPSGNISIKNLKFQDFIPNVEALTITTQVVEEFLASLYYFLRGWLSPVIF